MSSLRIGAVLGLALLLCGSARAENVDPAASTVVVDRVDGVVADGVDEVVVTVRVLKDNGQPWSNRTVSLTVSGTANTIVQPGQTNGSGVAVGRVRSTRAELKTIRATVSWGSHSVLLNAAPTVNFVAGPLVGLAFVNAPISATGTLLGPAVVVGRDANDNLLFLPPPRMVTVALQSGPPGAILSGTLTRPASATAVFQGLSVDRAGDYRLVATSPGLASAVSLVIPVRLSLLAWARSVTSVDDAEVQPLGVAATADGGTVATGYFTRTATFGPGEAGEAQLARSSAPTAFIARYRPDGTLLWARQSQGSGSNAAVGVALAPDGSIAVAGWFYGGIVLGPGEVNEASLESEGGGADVFVARFSATGEFLWAQRAGGAAFDNVNAITALQDGSQVMVGSFEGQATFGQGADAVVLTSTGANDAFVARYSVTGALQWARNPGSQDPIDGAIGVAALGNDVVVSGTCGPQLTLEPGGPALAGPGSRNAFVTRYAPDGTPAWGKLLGGAGLVFGRVAVAPGGDVLLGGTFTLDVVVGAGEPSATTLTGSTSDSPFVARFSPNGALRWARQGAGDAGFSALGVGADGAVVLTGTTSYVIFGAGPGAVTVQALTTDGRQARQGVMLVRYDEQGTLQSAKALTLSGFLPSTPSRMAHAIGRSIAVHPDGATVLFNYGNPNVVVGEGEPTRTALTTTTQTMGLARVGP